MENFVLMNNVPGFLWGLFSFSAQFSCRLCLWSVINPEIIYPPDFPMPTS